MKILIPILTLVFALGVTPAFAAEGGEYKVYVTDKSKSDVPLFKPGKQFACREKIYGVVEINRADKDNGKHTLYATWRNPSGEDQEVTKYEFQMVNGSARIWAWLQLHRSAESSLTQFMNPSGGLEEFAGEWELRVRIDDQPVGSRKFELLC